MGSCCWRCSALLAFAAIGFIDDYAKVSKQQNLGLTSKKKFSLQILVSFDRRHRFAGAG